MLAGLCLALGEAGDARAQALASRSALIIAVSTYAAADIPALAGVPFDIDSALAVAQAMGIPPGQTRILRDGQATKAAILDELETLADRITDGSRVFVYFSGHGTRWYESALEGCKEGLLAYDGQAITNEEIAHRTRRMSLLADKVVVMFDACHSEGVGGHRARSLAVASGAMAPKFFLKSGFDMDRCSKPSNVITRELLTEATRLGALQENFVQITSSRADEVSFDEPGKGGVATQSIRDCLLGQAEDRDASGAISIAEVEHCAQASIEKKLRPFADLRPHHISVSGNRNIVPVLAIRPPAVPAQQAALAPGMAPAAAMAALPQAPMPDAAPPAPAPSPDPVLAIRPPEVPAQQAALAAGLAPAAAMAALPLAPTPNTAPPPEPARAWLATLRDIDAQRNPRRRVEATLGQPRLKIGRDPMALSVRSTHDGYVYVVLVGSDRKSFYLVFPNGLDSDNTIRAGLPLALPRPGWELMAAGPAGTNHLLVLVSDTPRDMSALRRPAADSAQPFTFTLNDLPGRSAMVDFFAGRGVTGRSESYGTQLLSVVEYD